MQVVLPAITMGVKMPAHGLIDMSSARKRSNIAHRLTMVTEGVTEAREDAFAQALSAAEWKEVAKLLQKSKHAAKLLNLLKNVITHRRYQTERAQLTQSIQQFRIDAHDVLTNNNPDKIPQLSRALDRFTVRTKQTIKDFRLGDKGAIRVLSALLTGEAYAVSVMANILWFAFFFMKYSKEVANFVKTGRFFTFATIGGDPVEWIETQAWYFRDLLVQWGWSEIAIRNIVHGLSGFNVVLDHDAAITQGCRIASRGLQRTVGRTLTCRPGVLLDVTSLQSVLTYTAYLQIAEVLVDVYVGLPMGGTSIIISALQRQVLTALLLSSMRIGLSLSKTAPFRKWLQTVWPDFSKMTGNVIGRNRDLANALQRYPVLPRNRPELPENRPEVVRNNPPTLQRRVTRAAARAAAAV